MRRWRQAFSKHLQTVNSSAMASKSSEPNHWLDITLLGSNRVPALAYGVGTAFFQDSSPKTVDAFKQAVLAGYRHLDTAQSYDNEKCIKEVLVELEKIARYPEGTTLDHDQSEQTGQKPT
jgi:hypothetical protein